MTPQISRFLDRLARSDDAAFVRLETIRFFHELGYPHVAMAYVLGARDRAPHLPARLHVPELSILYGNCHAGSTTAPPASVKQRLIRSPQPFYWACGRVASETERRLTEDPRWVVGAREWASDLDLTSGLVIPLRATIMRIPGMMFVLSRASPVSFEKQMERDGPLLSFAALAAHERLLELAEAKVRSAYRLSSREIECLQWLAQGLRSDRIAERMQITPATVAFHFNSIRRKLDASTREEALAKALLIGLLEL